MYVKYAISLQYLIVFHFLNFQFLEPLGYSSMLYDERKRINKSHKLQLGEFKVFPVSTKRISGCYNM